MKVVYSILGTAAGLMFGIAITLTYDDRVQESRQAISQCEAELPRHMKCKAVITAEVVK